MKAKILFLLLLIVYCSRPTLAEAIEKRNLYFEDDFSSSLDSNWNTSNIGGQIITGPTGLVLSSNSANFPFISSNRNIFPIDGNYEISIDYSYPSTSDFGVGFGFGNYIPPYNNLNWPPTQDFNRWIFFYSWQGKNDGHLFLGRNCSTDTICDQNLTFLLKTIPDNLIHNLTVKYVDNNFELFHNGNKIDNQILINSNRRPTDFWIGNPVRLSTSHVWTSINVKKISVYSILDIIPEKEKVVILPGFGGSWDVNAVLGGTAGNNWQIPSFVKEYDGIINSLKAASYEEGKDFYVFPYDWRKNLDDLATDLNEYILANKIADKKINLVGHSMGGLVARTYLQKYNNPNLNKVIMAGSPNKGIVDAYSIWEGASAGESVWWQKTLLEIASEVNRKIGETKIEAVRRIAPSVKDLMPTENFLIANSISKPWDSLIWKNLFLSGKNIEVTTFLPKLISGASDEYNSRSAMNVEEPSAKEKLQGLWADGKPTKTNTYLYSLGDGYVNLNSAQSLFDKKLDLSGGHGDVISKKENVVKILTELGIATESAVGSESETKKNVFVAKLNSPGKLHVCYLTVCDSALGLVFETEKMIIVPGYNNEKYSIIVDSKGETGVYELMVGEIDENGVWKELNGKLSSVTQKDNYFYDGVSNLLTADQGTTDRNISIFWPKKIKLDEINDLREKILHDLDKNIKKKDIAEFDLNLKKWRALDFLVVSKGIKETDEEKHTEQSKYLTKGPNYYAASLSEMLSEIEAEMLLIPSDKRKLREDKKIQINMLERFIGLKNNTPWWGR
jgi:pimeloyl-ACP methyl ester carboxylesterase